MKNEIVFKNEVIKTNDITAASLKAYPFWIQDIYDFIKNDHDSIIELTNIFIPEEERLKGKGSKLIQEYIKENIKEDKLYFVIAGASRIEYTEEQNYNMTRPQFDLILSILDNFYTKNCFVNINRITFTYEDNQVYLYLNQAGLKLVKDLMSTINQVSYLSFPRIDV